MSSYRKRTRHDSPRIDPATLPKWDVFPEGPVQLHSRGRPLSAGAKLVHSGSRRGLKYEIYFEPHPARRLGGGMTSSGHEGRHYVAVVYSPYYSDKVGRGVEESV